MNKKIYLEKILNFLDVGGDAHSTFNWLQAAMKIKTFWHWI
jgi:hypothetical protein